LDAGQVPGFLSKFSGLGYPNLKYVDLRTDKKRRLCWAWARRATQGATMSKLLVRFVKDQSAATAIEYGLIAAGISIAIIAAVNGLGTELNTTFSSISTQLK
jgi:pilus assembly protein Flp/PilA